MKRTIAALALTLLSACDIHGRILMLGDSNMSFSASAYAARLFSGWAGDHYVMPAPGYLPTLLPAPGSDLEHDVTTWVTTLAQVGGEYDATVVNLGLNDCMVGPRFPGEPVVAFNAADYAARIDALMAALPSGPVVVLDVPYVPSALYSNADETNVNIAWQAAYWRHYPRITYVNVNSTINVLPAAQRFNADGMHYSAASQQLLATAIVNALDAVL